MSHLTMKVGEHQVVIRRPKHKEFPIEAMRRRVGYFVMERSKATDLDPEMDNWVELYDRHLLRSQKLLEDVVAKCRETLIATVVKVDGEAPNAKRIADAFPELDDDAPESEYGSTAQVWADAVMTYLALLEEEASLPPSEAPSLSSQDGAASVSAGWSTPALVNG